MIDPRAMPSYVKMLKALILTAFLGGGTLVAQDYAKPHECPVAPVDTSGWVLSRNDDVGIELKHPADYREIHFGSRSDTSGIAAAFWCSAASRIEFHEPRGFWSHHAPNRSVAPCLLRMRSAAVPLYIERTVTTQWNGRDTLYFVAKAVFTPPGKPQFLAEIGAPDSTGLLEQIMILRTIRFLTER